MSINNVDKKNTNAEKTVVLSDRFFLSAGETNAEREMSLPLLTSKLIDIATSHANNLGIGNPSMESGNTGWVLSRLTIEMTDYPIIDEYYELSTWVESWNRHFSERAFCLNGSHGEIKGFARSIWMVLNTETHSNAGLQGLNFNQEWIADRECPIERQGKHYPILTEEESQDAKGKFLIADSVNKYVFRYSDLDAYRHVNTVRYVQLLMNQFSLSMHDAFYVKRIELSFLNEGKYGEPLEILCHEYMQSEMLTGSDSHDSLESGHELPQKSYAFLLRNTSDKSHVLFARIYFEKRNRPIPEL